MFEISYETAKLLSTKNYLYNLEVSHWIVDKNNKYYWISAIGAYKFVDGEPNLNNPDAYERPNDSFYAVPRPEIRDWLRDKYMIDIEILVANKLSKTYHFKIIPSLSSGAMVYSSFPRVFMSYESSEEDAIKYVLENLI